MNESTFAKAPKILPWLAHKAGIDDRRAETLWQAALRHAAQHHVRDTSSYWQAALDKIEELITAESERQDNASFGWRPWARNLADFLVARMDVLDELSLASVRTWRIVGQHMHSPLMH